MQRFTNILLVVDERAESRVVVERAVLLAQRNRARLTVVQAVEELSQEATEPVTLELSPDSPEMVVDIIEEWPHRTDPSAPDRPAVLQESFREWPGQAEAPAREAPVTIREYIIEQESRHLEQWIEFIRDSGVPASGKVLYGTPFLEIIREVLRNKHDLVMTIAEGSASLKERLFGSTTMHLMRKCPCPVWVIKPVQPEWHTRILAAVDPNPMDEEKHSLSVKIMDLATSLAQRQQSELVIVHTWTFPIEHSLRNRAVGPPEEVDRWVAEARDLHKRRLSKLLQPYPLQDLKSQVYLLKGEPGTLIPELAAEMQVGLIVMGTVSRSGVSGLLIGNTSEKILRLVDCSVLTVKPDGFVSPVTLEE